MTTKLRPKAHRVDELPLEDSERISPDSETMEKSSGPEGHAGLGAKSSRFFERFKMNRKLLPMKMHFLWRTMGCAPLGMFMTLIMRQRGLSPVGIGLIHTIVRTLSIILGTFLITLTDFLKAHRTFFYVSTLITPFALSGVYWAPHVGIPSGTNATAQDVVLANSTGGLLLMNETKIADVAKFPEVVINIPEIDGVSEDEFIEYNVSHANSLPTSQPLFSVNETGEPNSHWKNETNAEQEGVLRVENKEEKDVQEATVSQLLQTSGFWFIFVCVFFIGTSFFVSNNLTDSICYHLLGENGHLYGQQRLFGTIAWGFCALVVGGLIDLYSLNLPERDYFPAFVLVVVFSTLDLFVLSRLQIVSGKEAEVDVSSKEFFRVMVAGKNFPFLLTVVVLSITMTIFGTYRLLLVEDVANAWDPDFKALKTLQGLVVAVQCFAGEIPVFIFAGDIILKMGITWSLVLVTGAHALRLLLYYPVTNPWFFLPIELLHGLQFGLYKSALTYQAAQLAPEGTMTTMLAVIKAVQYGGSALAGVTGGFLYQWLGGAETFLATGSFLVLYGAFYIVISFVAPCCSTKKMTFGVTPPPSAV
ncbi:major facilitator superfamily domain-containing protein 6-like [Oratosquilla oratoria]|uniref:major facilitator superfamily domain-containing protein 6-like n=1 Tax=Oratosquilla oratoria TaxID=337810 RepID=UPI003F764166